MLLVSRGRQSGFQAFPQVYTYVSIKYNIATITAPHEALTCHEVGHALGLMHVIAVGNKGSHATCQGNPEIFNDLGGRPGIDDEQAMVKIYSTPLANGP